MNAMKYKNIKIKRNENHNIAVGSFSALFKEGTKNRML
jgi:hypothetical protein